ncbi:hypothetical protein A1A1_09756 [Planococcus antarcticus DSM 14505]|uniref:DUF1648 domain-containing protein n=1 Tax=Planococcus antarcticus DSM 14505 TaxID=1185653 RepID=A0A1C7DHI7_9BACL|nr:hypothetical protein [Planococcus antarcticus]ANU10731.1 hypothetical protein BBH88_10630 [Planococcus antarcticus DSM 14505]EIM06823.1 hypothetical protein A1A1_09756 [Planococcus antarcticus DSM 14505]
MYKIFMLLYGLSAILLIAAFYGMNYFNAPVKNDDFWGGNGHLAFFIPVVLMPFILYFLYGTIELSMRIADRWLSQKKIVFGISLSLAYILATSLWTIRVADRFRMYIVDTKDAYNKPAQFPMFNVFSNHLFFNPFTFILVVLVCFVVGAVWSLARKTTRKM